eukprot:1431319-Pyramimonas_sp.AAC.1
MMTLVMIGLHVAVSHAWPSDSSPPRRSRVSTTSPVLPLAPLTRPSSRPPSTSSLQASTRPRSREFDPQPVVATCLPVHRGRVRQPPTPEPRATLRIEPFNANRGLRNLKERIQQTPAVVFVAQEVGITADQKDELTAWAGRCGWLSLIHI